MVSKFNDDDISRLLLDKGIIRNKLKINAIIFNAQVIVTIQKKYGSFKKWLDFNHPKERKEWVKLFKKTFKFAGGEITNEFLIVTNKKDKKGLIKIGNERVVDARLSDAEFFWNKDKTQNLVKKVSELKSMNFFKGLGSYFDKVQRMRKIGGMISDELLISKEKVELLASICKTDLTSDLVGEFPELQGLMGGYFSEYQGFDKDISLAISEQYLPIGLNSIVPKKPFSVTLSITDKIDT